MEIKGLAKTTLLDYPGHVAATIFTGGCDFKCPFCHNKSLVMHPDRLPSIPVEEIYDFLSAGKRLWRAYASPAGSLFCRMICVNFYIM